MAQNLKKSIKPAVIKLRKQGFSYSEIQKEVYVPRSTLSLWLKKIKLTEAQLEKLYQKKIRAAREGSNKKITRTLKAIEDIRRTSANDIKNISSRELWLMGTMLYWRERFLRKNESDIKKGVRFTSSDPSLIKLFLKWLRKAGRLKKEEIAFDIFLAENQKENLRIVRNYWSNITGFSKSYFPRIYFQKYKTKRRKPGVKRRMIKNKMQFGMLRVRVKASSMLARQISGWIRGVQKILLD